MILYLIKSIIILSIFFGIYLLFLEREKMHRFNRAYLLGAIVLGFAIPLLSFNLISFPSPALDNEFHGAKEIIEKSVEAPTVFLSESIGTPVNSAKKGRTAYNYRTRVSQLKNAGRGNVGVLIVYLLGVGICLVRFLMGLKLIYAQIRDGRKMAYQSAKLVLLKQEIVPHSFLNYIFVNEHEYDTGSMPEEILNHELVHVRQYHTLDIFFIELVSIICWFNPMVHLYKKPIKVNHEFLADQAILESSTTVDKYQQMLLDAVREMRTSPLASTLTYSLTKKRLIMMVKESSSFIMSTKGLALIPVIASLALFFSTEERYYMQRSILGDDYRVSTLSVPEQYHYSDVTLHYKLIKEDGQYFVDGREYDDEGNYYTGVQNWYVKDTRALFISQTFEEGRLVERLKLDEQGNIINRVVREYDEETSSSVRVYHYTDEGLEFLRYNTKRGNGVTLLESYYQNGQLEASRSILGENGRTDGAAISHGLATQYDEQGNITSQKRYEKGELIETIVKL